MAREEQTKTRTNKYVKSILCPGSSKPYTREFHRTKAEIECIILNNDFTTNGLHFHRI